jgi:hypothetical protein
MTNKATLKVTLVVSILIFAAVIAYSSYFSYLNNSNSFVFAEQSKCFNAKLTGKDEVPSKVTKATGMAGFNVIGTDSLSYNVNVTNMQKVTASHIHQGKAGTNGPVVVTLFKTNSPSATTNGLLSKGTITATNLEGPLKGKQISDLISMIKSGNAYVNVHTEANPKGEIRGQLSPM